jgi:hypothetical protein
MNHKTSSAQCRRTLIAIRSVSDFGRVLLALVVAVGVAAVPARLGDYPHAQVAVPCTIEWTKTALAAIYIARAIASLAEKGMVAIACCASTAALAYRDFGLAAANARIPFFPILVWADLSLLGCVLVPLCLGTAWRSVLAPPSVATQFRNGNWFVQFSVMRLLAAIFLCACVAWAASHVEIGVSTALRRAWLLVAVTAPCGCTTALLALAAFTRRGASLLYIIMAALVTGAIELAIPFASKDPLGPASGRYLAMQASAVVILAAVMLVVLRARGWQWIEPRQNRSPLRDQDRSGVGK